MLPQPLVYLLTLPLLSLAKRNVTGGVDLDQTAYTLVSSSLNVVTTKLTFGRERICYYLVSVGWPRVTYFAHYDAGRGQCPPCFNCLLPAFNCGQYGECNPYDGQCKCPPGWGGIDCLVPRKLL